MVRFDDSRFAAKSAFYHIRINGSLYQEVYSADFFRFFFKYTDKFFTDDLTFLFRFFYPFEFFIKTILSVYADDVQVVVSVRSEDSFYFIPFIFSQ